MTTQFSFPKRYDESEAKDGVVFSVYDELDNHWGDYKVALFNTTDRRVQKALERFARANKGARYKAEEALYRAFIEIALLDWDNVALGKDGAAIPFSKKAALDLLLDDGATFLIRTLVTFAEDVTNFKGNPEATQEEDAKN